MAKAMLTYSLGSLSFSRIVLQAVLKVFCGQNWWPYSCRFRRTQQWCGVDIPSVPVLCSHKLFKQVSYKNRENRNLSLEAFQFCFCFHPLQDQNKPPKVKNISPFWCQLLGPEIIWGFLPGRCLTWQVCFVGPQCSFWQKKIWYVLHAG